MYDGRNHPPLISGVREGVLLHLVAKTVVFLLLFRLCALRNGIATGRGINYKLGYVARIPFLASE